MPPSLMQPFITYVVARRLSESDITDAAFARALGRDRSTAKRMLDGETTYSRGDGIDHTVSRVADLIGVSPLELWAEALREWKQDPDGDLLPTRHRGLRAARRAAEA